VNPKMTITAIRMDTATRIVMGMIGSLLLKTKV
jgi:hypothetical protein